MTDMALITNPNEVRNCFPTCYACNEPKTSLEHVPPLCFFPETKDEKGSALYRQNLIKVPSCDKHNTKKSSEDVYALWHIAAQDGLNHCGQLMIEKLRRMSIHDEVERGGRFRKLMGDEIIEWHESGRPLIKVNRQRMVDSLCLMARGLYFAHTFTKLLHPLRVTNIANYFPDPIKTEELRKREAFFDSEVADAEILGANPDVFNYSIQHTSAGVILVRMVFYGTSKYWVFYAPQKTDEPSRLWLPGDGWS